MLENLSHFKGIITCPKCGNVSILGIGCTWDRETPPGTWRLCGWGNGIRLQSHYTLMSLKRGFISYFCFVGGAPLAVLRTYSRLWAQESLLAELEQWDKQ